MTYTMYLKDGSTSIIPNNTNRTYQQVLEIALELYGHNLDRIEEATE